MAQQSLLDISMLLTTYISSSLMLYYDDSCTVPI